MAAYNAMDRAKRINKHANPAYMDSQQQAHTLLARLDQLGGHHQAVVNRLQPLKPLPELTALPDGSTYTRVVIIMAHFIHGIVL